MNLNDYIINFTTSIQRMQNLLCTKRTPVEQVARSVNSLFFALLIMINQHAIRAGIQFLEISSWS